jgi:hypothetical protein
MLNRLDHEEHHRSARDVPPVARPKGATWRSLQADGIVWEGQVLLVGGSVDLAARMIVTHRRVAFVRGGEISLEVPRGWLRQEPVLRRDGILELFVSTPDSNPFDEPMSIRLRMREGHPAAGHIIAMLAPGGVRRIVPDSVSAIERAKEAAPSSSYGGFWSGMEDSAVDRRPHMADVGPRLLSLGEDEGPPSDLPPFEPPDRLIRPSSAVPTRQAAHPATGFSIAGLAPRDQRRSSWGLALRAAALLLLLVTAAAFGAGRLNLSLPGTAPSAEAVLTAPPPTDAPSETSNPDNLVNTPDSETATGDAALSPAELTAVAVGVGGAEEEPAPVEAASNAVTQAEDPGPAASEPTVAEETAAIPTPAAVVEAEQPESTVSAASQPAAPTSAPAAVAEAAPTTTEPEPAANSSALVVGDVTVSIDSAQRAESLPPYGLPPGSGEWVVIVASMRNDGDAAASLPMSGFRLQDRGRNQVVELDTGVGVIASLAGIQPGRDASESINLDPGASTEVLLLYLLPADASNDLALSAGDTTMDLAPYLSPDGSEPEVVESTLANTVNG